MKKVKSANKIFTFIYVMLIFINNIGPNNVNVIWAFHITIAGRLVGPIGMLHTPENSTVRLIFTLIDEAILAIHQISDDNDHSTSYSIDMHVRL
jgi:hypothetical protein